MIVLQLYHISGVYHHPQLGGVTDQAFRMPCCLTHPSIINQKSKIYNPNRPSQLLSPEAASSRRRAPRSQEAPELARLPPEGV
jgi:hypothetical protein